MPLADLSISVQERGLKRASVGMQHARAQAAKFEDIAIRLQLLLLTGDTRVWVQPLIGLVACKGCYDRVAQGCNQGQMPAAGFTDSANQLAVLVFLIEVGHENEEAVLADVALGGEKRRDMIRLFRQYPLSGEQIANLRKVWNRGSGTEQRARFVAVTQQTDRIAAQRREFGESRRRVHETCDAGESTRIEGTGKGNVDEQEHVQLLLVCEAPNHASATARSRLPVDGAWRVTPLVFAQ